MSAKNNHFTHKWKTYILVSSYLYTHISHLLSFDINEMISFNTKYFFFLKDFYDMKCDGYPILCQRGKLVYLSQWLQLLVYGLRKAQVFSPRALQNDVDTTFSFSILLFLETNMHTWERERMRFYIKT